jgi:hypothetical protein
VSEEGTPAHYELKFKNGIIAQALSLDEVLAQENSGSTQIVRLRATFGAENDKSRGYVSVEFINADEEEESGDTSSRYVVTGSTRDWVFITTSLLEERITKIKRFALNQLNKRGPMRTLLVNLVPGIIVLAFMVGMLNHIGSQAEKSEVSARLAEAKAQGKLRDPVDALITYAQLNEQAAAGLRYHLFTGIAAPLALFGGLVAFLFLAAWFITHYYPVYNFCWGDYAEIFRRKESTRKFVIGVLLVGVLVSFLGGVLANYFRAH